MNQLPLVEELTPAPDVSSALRALRDLPGVILFDSARRGIPTGRYSFLAADPFHFEVLPNAAPASNDPLADLERRLSEYPVAAVAGLPPFQGGVAGMMSYELNRAWERIPGSRCDEFDLPSLAVGLYDWVIAWDHEQSRAWIISHGFPETDRARRTDRAANRLRLIRDRLSAEILCNRDMRQAPGDIRRLPVEQLSPQWQVPGLEGLLSNFSRDTYLRAVERAIEYIYAGDIFQVNLSQRLLYPAPGDPLELYLRLRECNPAPLAGYFAHDDWVVASASPERFVRVAGGEVETRPIKGTRRRRSGPEADLFTRDELRESDKDQAENVMIVDLLRNDLSRVCAAGTVRVPELCRVESYETVQHLVSEVRGKLQPGRTAWDLLRAVFPGGSITGAPKVRAMEIISELEPTARGPYCGSLFYIGYDGTADSSILIRTFTIRRGWIQCPVGGGIVAQSDPAAEYEETLVKAEGMLRALR
ncbi:MAG: anthranilate synthase component I family protein [Planctomycetia bacterium]|nr:anthranilate synthase component I family protein [Planctomycetia bacterium]